MPPLRVPRRPRSRSGSHPQCLAHQGSRGDLSGALGIRWTGFESHDMATQLQLGGILDGDHVPRKGSPRTERSATSSCPIRCRRRPTHCVAHALRLQGRGSCVIDPSSSDQVVEGRHRGAETPHGHNRTIDRSRRDHGVEP